jgi:hypothetical protein
VTVASLRPTLAAVLIVRDEAANLPACLASLTSVVDEIHVHDTGSTDGTPEIAAQLGAIVTRGAWTGDFAAARNAALAGWSSEWALSIDADERATADGGRLRQLLRHTEADTLQVEIDNASDELAYTHRAERLFRPSVAVWIGSVHERLTALGKTLRTAAVPRSLLALDHVGYRTADLRGPKSARNADIAQATLDELCRQNPVDAAAVARTLLDLGRSFVGADRKQDAIDTFETVRNMFPGTPEWLQATDFLARLLLAAGLDELSIALAGQLRDAGAAASYCDWLEAQALAQLGQVDRARTLLRGVHEVVDTAGRRHAPAALGELKQLVSDLALINVTADRAHGVDTMRTDDRRAAGAPSS